jgi:hypothetical protein
MAVVAILQQLRLRNFGIKPPKRGIELGWVTRGTRPKKPSSSRGFAHGARAVRGVRGIRGFWGFRGFWGLKTESRKSKIVNFFSLPKPATTTKKII